MYALGRTRSSRRWRFRTRRWRRSRSWAGVVVLRRCTAPRTSIIVRFALERKGRDATVEHVAVLALHAERAPHVATRRLQTHVRAVLEGRQAGAEHGFLADDTPATDRFQRAREGEDSPVSFAQLDAQFAEVLQPDAVAPLENGS